MVPMMFLTDFADQGVILPVVGGVAVALIVMGQQRTAFVWAGIALVTLLAILLLKVCFLACGPVFATVALSSPSGHTAAASVVAGGLAALLTKRRWIIVTAAVSCGALVGVSRYVMSFHSPQEIIVGAVIGIGGAMLMAGLVRPVAPRRAGVLLLVVCITMALSYGSQLRAEVTIRDLSSGLLDFVSACRR